MKKILLFITMLFLFTGYVESKETDLQVENYVKEQVLLHNPELKSVVVKLKRYESYASNNTVAILSVYYFANDGKKGEVNAYMDINHTFKDSKGNFTIISITIADKKKLKKIPGLLDRLATL